MPIGATDKLIEQHIKQWELAQRAMPSATMPCVALSRLPGTPAAAIGQRVAERLGYAFFGIELVDEIARTEDVTADVVGYMDEHVRSTLDRYLLDLFRNADYDERDYLHSVGRVMRAFGDKGSAVLLGRGAPFLLDASQALRVQVIASRETRTKRLADVRQCSVRDAQTALAEEEQARLKFLREFVSDPDDAGHFDLVVNTDYRDEDYWVDLVVFAVERLQADN